MLLQMTFQLLLLPYQMRRFLVIHILEHGLQRRLRPRLRRLHGTQHGNALLVLDARDIVLVRPSEMLEKAFEPQYGIGDVGGVLHLVGVAISRAVVGGAVMALAVGHGFDHDGGGGFEGKFASLGDGGVDGEDVVAVDADAGHAVSGSSGDDAVSGILIFHGSRNGKPIIPTKENHGHLQRGGKVARRMKIHRRRRPISKVHDRNARIPLGIHLLLQLELICRSYRLRDLRPQRAAHGLIPQRPTPVMDRHLPSPSQIQIVREALIAELFQGEAPPHEHAGLAVLGEDVIVRAEGRRGPRVDGLLAVMGHVERYPALALGVVEDGVHLAESDHLAVGAQEGVGGMGVGVVAGSALEERAGSEVFGEVGVLREERRLEFGEIVLGGKDFGGVGVTGGVLLTKVAAFVHHAKHGPNTAGRVFPRENDLEFGRDGQLRIPGVRKVTRHVLLLLFLGLDGNDEFHNLSFLQLILDLGLLGVAFRHLRYHGRRTRHLRRFDDGVPFVINIIHSRYHLRKRSRREGPTIVRGVDFVVRG
mmetsp:Transcript_16470/g.28240  ORF Transcript_16470/g.28240 Transcript_16470/m.28240 type:complete len:533 (-) Transcript_16470:376-1974(-)